MAENKKLITADNSFLTYMGRIDFSEKTRPEFYYAGSNVKMTFTGTSVSAVIKNHKYFNIQELGFVMDGKEGKVTFDKMTRISPLISLVTLKKALIQSPFLKDRTPPITLSSWALR